MDGTSKPPSRNLWEIPMTDRPTHGPWFSYILFPIVFNVGLLSINSTQLICWPLGILPITQPIHQAIIRKTKSSFCSLILLITVLFGPTSFTLTAGEGVDLEQIVRKRPDGGVSLELPKRAVVIGNHQAYSDWLYIWMLGYLAGTSDGIYILLKKSLKWIPVVGWGCQSFDFLFLARRWAQDQGPLGIYLNRLKTTEGPCWMMVFPEGTIVSDEERSKSLAYAQKQNIEDTTNVLLPRSLGLQTILGQLPLPVLDVTIGYPGVPPGGKAQEYYNLFSIFHRSVPPPSIHLHLRLYDPADIPLQDQGEGFGTWLLDRWREKDQLMERFYRTGSMEDREGESVDVSLMYRDKWEAGEAVCWGLPIGVGAVSWAVWKSFFV